MCRSENKPFYLFVLGVLAILGLLALIFWLSLRPNPPSYTITSITIPISNSEDGSQNSSIAYTLQIENSNKDSSVYYDDSLMTFYYGEDKAAEKVIPSFHQGRDKTHSVIVYMDANTRVWRAVRSSILNATAELKVALLTRIQYKTWGIKSKHHGLHLGGALPLGKDGKLSGKKKKVKLRNASKKLRRNSLRY